MPPILFLPLPKYTSIRSAAPFFPSGTTDISTEEREMRATFNVEQGSNLPADLCICVENVPTRWNVVPIEEHSFEGISSRYREDHREFLPSVDNDLLAEVCLPDTPWYLSLTYFMQARQRITKAEAIVRMGTGTGSQSL